MNSCLYECSVMHHRLKPKQNRFHYNFFMFCLDLDEIDFVAKTNLFINRNRFNLFNFRDRDHMQLFDEKTNQTKTVKDQILYYLEQNGVDTARVDKIMLVTNLCTLGYQFNPVSFYFCFDADNQPICSVAEVCNTFREMKIYFLGKENFREGKFNASHTKHFYVSPFIAMDADFHFQLSIPGNRLNININDYQQGELFFMSTLTGKKEALTNWNVFRYAIRFPFVTQKIITLIHWQAFCLWLKRIGHYKKASFIELQKEVLRPHKSITE